MHAFAAKLGETFKAVQMDIARNYMNMDCKKDSNIGWDRIQTVTRKEKKTYRI
jgi:hypothetical protein